MDSSFYHLLKVCSKNYCYDVNSNLIFEIDDMQYNFLKSNNSYNDIISSNLFTTYVKKNIFSINRPKIIENNLIYYMNSLLSNNIMTMTLQVTTGCNFYCSYCPYSGTGILDRKHNNGYMKWDIAKRSIDYLIEHSSLSRNIDLSFFGGEPFFNFSLIKKCVNYINESIYDRNVTYRLTTNASLLNDEMLSFFDFNNFEIIISLDGPMNVQNKNRKFAIDGTGTFDVVYENLKRINDSYPNLAKKVIINAVLDSENDLVRTNEFFLKDSVLKKFFINYSPLSRNYLDNKFGSCETSYIYEKYLELNSFLNYDNNSIRNTNQFKKNYEVFLKNLNNKNGITSRYHHSGPCPVGLYKLFVDINGNFRPCEKISEKSDHCIIGNIYEGFNINKVIEEINIGKITENECKNCWAMRFCGICIEQIDNLKEFSRDIKLKLCSNHRINTEKN